MCSFDFRTLSYLHLAFARSNGQGEVIYMFKYSYLVNGGRQDIMFILSTSAKEKLDYFKGHLQMVQSDIRDFDRL